MSKLVCLKDYNNYYNRIIKVDNFGELVQYTHHNLNNINFVPGNDINTEQVINWNQSWMPNYIAVTNDNVVIDNVLDKMTYFSLTTEETLSVDGHDAAMTALTTNNFYNDTTKKLALDTIAAWHNDSYGNVTMTMEGNWALDDFGMTMHVPNGVTLRVWSDENDISISVTGNEVIINKAYLLTKGWDAEDPTGVWGFTIFAGSPDTFSGTILTESYENAPILSRWFVIDHQRTRQGQYVCQLRRDLIADYYNPVINAQTFIEKATVGSDSNLIFNNENMTYNQVKTDEIMLNDRTGTAWIVGYLSNKRSTAIEGSITYGGRADYDQSSINHDAWAYYSYVGNGFKEVKSGFKVTFKAAWWHSSFWPWDNYFTTHTYTQTSNTRNHSWEKTNEAAYGTRMSHDACNKIGDAPRNQWFNWSSLKNKIISDRGAVSDSVIKDITNMNGRTIKFADGLYIVKVDSSGTPEELTKTYNANTQGSGTTAIDEATATIVSNVASLGITPEGQNIYNAAIEYKEITHTLSLIPTADSTEYTYTYSIGAGVQQLTDAPYTMFCIPCYLNGQGAQLWVAEEDSSEQGWHNLAYNLDPDLMLAWVQSLIKEADVNLYDVQLLPYSPLINDLGVMTSMSGQGHIKLVQHAGAFTEGKDYIYLKRNNANYGIMWFPRKSSFSFTMNNLLRPYQTTSYPDVSTFFPLTDLKVQNETEVYRLVSPNYASQFEFSLAKNRGIKRFNVDCTYKPYNPYIQIAPDFNGLYGIDYNDARGLICSGEFSLPIVTDNWKNYELNNKNYQLAFDRQIENMEVNNSVQREKETVQMYTGAISGAASGAMTAGMASGGNTYAAAAGAVIGGVTSLVAGAEDRRLNDKLRSEALDYTKDQFGYQLGNIKALPYSLKRVSSFNSVSKYFPFIEVYKATDEEIEALRNKLKYNGMTVMAIGRITDYLQNDYSYIKGQIIRLDDLSESFDIVNAIADEINKGVFIKLE